MVQMTIRLAVSALVLTAVLTVRSAHAASGDAGTVSYSTSITETRVVLHGDVPGIIPASNTVQTRVYIVPAPATVCDMTYRAHPEYLRDHPELASIPCTIKEIVTAHSAVASSASSAFPDIIYCNGAPVGPTNYCTEGYDYQTCSNTFGGCKNWSNEVYGVAQYNFSYVYIYGSVSCNPTSYWPYSQSIYWCGVSNNGGQGSGYMTVGDDWHVYALGQTCTFYQRLQIYTNGNFGTVYGSGTGASECQ